MAGAASGLIRQVLQDAPGQFWTLDETSGTVAADASGNGRPGAYQNAPNLTDKAGLPTTPLLLNGSTNYVRGSYHSALDVGAGDFAMECWVALTNPTSNYVQVLSRDASASGNGALIYLDTGTGYMRGYAAGAAATATSQRVSDGVPHHLVLQRSSGTVTGYLDAVAVLSFAAAGSTNLGANGELRAGTADGGFQFAAGRIGHVAWYTSALLLNRIQVHYQAGLRSGVLT